MAFDIDSVPGSDPLSPSSKEIIDDLNTLSKNKWYSPISSNNLTLFLDETYGFQVIGIFYIS